MVSAQKDLLNVVTNVDYSNLGVKEGVGEDGGAIMSPPRHAWASSW